ncbi:ATP-dependent DNA helicase sgs1 [Mortierella alpina]|nr:ATP-dependent DNA helicase sgs1 [Mortierella alpina]
MRDQAMQLVDKGVPTVVFRSSIVATGSKFIEWKETHPAVPIMAPAAAVNVEVQCDILETLGIQDCLVLKQSFNRKNLYNEIRPKTEFLYNDIHEFTSARPAGASGIIYCTRRDDLGSNAQHYHAGLDVSDRDRIQKSWMDGKTQIIVATVAF